MSPSPLRALSLTLLLGGCADTVATTIVGEVEVTTVRRSYANVHVARAGDAVVLVDAGLAADGARLVDALGRLGLGRGDVDAIVVTHGHADHAGGAAALREAFGAPVVLGAGDVGLAASGENDRLCPTDAQARGRVDRDQAVTFTPFTADVVVPADGAWVLPVAGGPTLSAVPLPGHTEGSLIVTWGEAAFVGDLLRGSITGRAARTHFYQCDLEDNHADVGTLLDGLAPNATTVFPGHFGPLTRGAVEAWWAAPR